MFKKLLRLFPLLGFLYFLCPLWMIGVATFFNLSGNQYESVYEMLMMGMGIPLVILASFYDKNRILLKNSP